MSPAISMLNVKDEASMFMSAVLKSPSTIMSKSRSLAVSREPTSKSSSLLPPVISITKSPLVAPYALSLSTSKNKSLLEPLTSISTVEVPIIEPIRLLDPPLKLTLKSMLSPSSRNLVSSEAEPPTLFPEPSCTISITELSPTWSM